MPPEDAGEFQGDVSLKDVQRYFMRVSTWDRMIQGLLEYTPTRCAVCNGPLESSLGFRLKCAACGEEVTLRSGDEINRDWVQQFFRERARKRDAGREFKLRPPVRSVWQKALFARKRGTVSGNEGPMTKATINLDQFGILAANLPGHLDTGIVVAACRRGAGEFPAYGILNLEGTADLSEARTALARVERLAHSEFGVKLDAGSQLAADLVGALPASAKTVIFASTGPTLGALDKEAARRRPPRICRSH